MSDDAQDLAAVEAILSERDALHGWLNRLDDAGSKTPQAVRARVRVDYERRLEAVTERLKGHTDTISTRLAADRAEHEDLAGRAQVSRDALAEAELRHAVGEYDGARFEQERSTHTGDIETFEISLGAIAERIARLEAVQALVSRAPGAVAPTPAPTVSEESAVVDRDARESEAVSSSAERSEKTAFETVAAELGDDDSFLAVFEPEDEEEEEPQEAPVRPGDIRGGLSFTPTGEFEAPRAPVVPPGSPPLGMPERDQKPRFVRPSPSRGSELAEAEEREKGTRSQATAIDVGTVELQPDPVLPEPAVDSGPRTLRCGECGAMNRPLEWYCEKCGAELTAG
ncbi:MAG TPA: hypothetical protein VFN22_13165 [Gemmatimonadales bacterium]|nr:hypothetical protein [Gemmatimonadales bacterium]